MIRLLLATAIGLLISLFGTRYLIRWLTQRSVAQPIQDDGVQMHRETKAGTPTMGGIAIVLAIAIAYVISDLYNGIYTRSGLLVLFAIVGSGVVGFADDWIIDFSVDFLNDLVFGNAAFLARTIGRN